MSDAVTEKEGLKPYKKDFKKKRPNPNAGMKGKMPREKKALRESGEEIKLSEEDLWRAMASLREAGYTLGTLRGTGNCRVSMWNLQEGYQFVFMRSSIQVVDLDSRRKFKIEYKQGFDVKEDGTLEIDLNRGVEIQL